MLKLQQRGDKFFYSILWNPVARVLKFENFSRYVSALPKGGKVLDYGAGDRPMEPMLKIHFDSYLAVITPPPTRPTPIVLTFSSQMKVWMSRTQQWIVLF